MTSTFTYLRNLFIYFLILQYIIYIEPRLQLISSSIYEAFMMDLALLEWSYCLTYSKTWLIFLLSIFTISFIIFI